MELSDRQRAALDRYRDLLLREGARTNLTALRDPEAIERRHFGESLALLEALERLGAFASPAIDIGAGAGFPGLPLKIARPNLRLTLLEATAKKADFLRLVVAELGLAHVTVIHGRAEELAHNPAHREEYAVALARAVAPLLVLAELALPFLRPGGYLAAPKGSAAPREVKEAARALELLGGGAAVIHPLPAGPHPALRLVLVKKVRATPPQYPRRPGIPSKRPL